MTNTHIYVRLVALAGALLSASAAHGAATPAAVGKKRPALTHDGVGPIHKDLPMDKPVVLKKLFKGCQLATSTKMMDNKPWEKVIEVACHGKPYYTLRAEAPHLKEIATAEVVAPGIKSPEGIAIGQTMADVYKLGQVDCDADVNPARVRCVYLGDTTIAYSAVDTTKGANGLLPPEDEIKHLKITGIIWRANML